MSKSRFRPLCRFVLAGLVACAALLTAPSPAGAVTYGSAVASPSRAVPWLLPLYYSRTSTATPAFICSSSALSAREVLTAAHCVQERGFYYVKVGADTLSGGKFVPVEAINDNSKFSSRLFVNDTAVLRPLFPLGLPAYARLAPPTVAKRIVSGHAPALKVIGWGRNQNGKVTGRLQAATVTPQGRAARKLFGATFRPGLMLAAGRYMPRTRTYAGACNGDSGGPLVAIVGRTQYVAGITSWGARSCNVKAPTVFTNIGAYRSWIATARRTLPRLAVTDNRAVPQNLSPPTVSGIAAMGSVLTCNPGVWSSNATAVRTSWLRSGSEVGTNATYAITAADAGRTLTCVVTASSQAGSRSVSAPALTLPTAPDGYATPAITGLPSSSVPMPGTVATCAAPTYDEPVTGVSYTWAWSDSAWTPGPVLGTGQTLLLTEDILRTVAGHYLFCTTTTSNAMGSDVVSESEYIYSLRPPSISVSTTPFLVRAGDVVTCSVSNFGSAASSTTYRWGIQSAYPGSTLASNALVLADTGSTHTVTSSDLAAMGSYGYLVCEATASNWQGSDTDTDYSTSY